MEHLPSPPYPENLTNVDELREYGRALHDHLMHVLDVLYRPPTEAAMEHAMSSWPDRKQTDGLERARFYLFAMILRAAGSRLTSMADSLPPAKDEEFQRWARDLERIQREGAEKASAIFGFNEEKRENHG